MAGGMRSKAPIGYFETEYVQPWPGIDVSKPSSQIDFGACISATGMSLRGGLTNQPAIVAPIGSVNAIVVPTFAVGEVVGEITNLNGVTIIITNIGVYADFCTPTSTTKTFSSIYTFTTQYSQAVRFGSVVIGNNLYFSSNEQLGVYEIGFTHSVIAVVLTNPGNGYSTAPSVTLSGGGGSGATATATLGSGSSGEVVSYTVAPIPTHGGAPSYCWLAPEPTITLTVTGGGGTGATCVATLGTIGAGSTLRWVITAVTPTAFGSGYTSTPTVTITWTGTLLGSLPTVTAQLYESGGSVAYLTLTAGGSGYTSPPTVTISPPPGTGNVTAQGVAILGANTGMSVSEITNHNGSGPFIGAAFLATIAQRLVLGNIIGGDGNATGTVQSVTVVAGGTSYPATGQVLFTGGGGQNAQGTFSASGGVINAIVVTNGGTGYTSAPTAVIISSTGGGFVGTTAISLAVSPSTTTNYPDYVAWSAANAYGYFDPNSAIAAGGYDQLTEARGQINGLAVFENVWFAAHNGGFTQITVNTNGSNIAPFTYNPLWSSDQGVICRFGSLAQYGAMCMFLGEDQAYQLSPNGLTPIGDPVASLLQNFSLWENGVYPNAGLYGSIVEIEGEKHYLIVFTSDDPTFGGDEDRQALIFDMNLKTGATHNWSYAGITINCPIYQSYDSQAMEATGYAQIVSDNLLLVGLSTTSGGKIQSQIGQAVAGQQLYNAGTDTRIASEAFAIQFRTETPVIGRLQIVRGIYVEYENLPAVQEAYGNATLALSINGQPDAVTGTAPLNVALSMTLPYYALSATIPPNMVLTATAQPESVTALSALSQSLSMSSSNLVRIIRICIFGETVQGVLQ